MRYFALLSGFGFVLGCQGSPPEQADPVIGDDAGAVTDAAAPDAEPPIVAVRNEAFDCDLTEAVGAPETIEFEDSTTDVFVISEEAPCQLKIEHQRTDGTVPDTVLFSGAYLFGAIGVQQSSSGTLVACTSRIQLSPPTTGDPEVNHHLIENVSIHCASNTGAGWSPVTTVAGPAGSEWAAWWHAIEPDASAPGEFDITWIRDFTLFPFTLVDEGRPPDDGVYSTHITVDSSGIVVGATTKVADSILSLNTEPGFMLPDGTEIPYGEEYEFEVTSEE